MQTFLGQVKVKKGVLHQGFQAFVKRALEWEATQDIQLEETNQIIKFVIMESTVHVHVLNSSVKDMNNSSLTMDVPQFGGASIVFLDIPKVSLVSIGKVCISRLSCLHTYLNICVHIHI